ncbi:MAG: hypothetical protein ABSA76_11445 [Bacteroidales bacterium]
MEHLEIKSGPFTVIRTVIAILNIAAGILMFIVSFSSGKILMKITPFFIVFFGLYLLTNGFGLERCWFRTGNNCLIIKWRNRVAPVQIHNSRVFKISLERTRVMIYRKEENPLKLDISFLEKEQKAEIFNFLIEYAKQKNLVIEKHSSTMI